MQFTRMHSYILYDAPQHISYLMTVKLTAFYNVSETTTIYSSFILHKGVSHFTLSTAKVGTVIFQV